jgi:hypothetical protein
MGLIFENFIPIVKPSQAMRAADREPAGGESPVELVCRQPSDNFLIAGWGVEDK